MTLRETTRSEQVLPNLKDYGLLLIIAAIWGSSFLFIKIGVADLAAIPFTTLRLILGALAMLGFCWWMKERIFGASLPWGLIWLSGLIGNALPFMLIGWGEEKIDSGLAAILMAVAPLATVLLAHVYTSDDRLTVGKAAGVALGISGIVILMGPSRLAEVGSETMRQLAVAVAAVFYALNVLITRKIQKTRASPTVLVTAVILTSAGIMLPVQLALSPSLNLSISMHALLSASILAVFHTATATILMFVLIERQGASFFSQINYLVPVFGVVWGVLFLAERPDWTAMLSLIFILGGMAVARRRDNLG